MAACIKNSTQLPVEANNNIDKYVDGISENEVMQTLYKVDMVKRRLADALKQSDLANLSKNLLNLNAITKLMARFESLDNILENKKVDKTGLENILKDPFGTPQFNENGAKTGYESLEHLSEITTKLCHCIRGELKNAFKQVALENMLKSGDDLERRLVDTMGLLNVEKDTSGVLQQLLRKEFVQYHKNCYIHKDIVNEGKAILDRVFKSKLAEIKPDDFKKNVSNIMDYWMKVAPDGSKPTDKIVEQVKNEIDKLEDTKLEDAYKVTNNISTELSKNMPNTPTIFVLVSLDVSGGLSGRTHMKKKSNEEPFTPRVYINVLQALKKLGYKDLKALKDSQVQQLVAGTIVHELSHRMGFDPAADPYDKDFEQDKLVSGHADPEYEFQDKKRWFVDPNFVAAVWLDAVI